MNIGWIVGIWKSHLPGLAMKHGLPKNPPFIIRWLGFAEDDFFSPWEIHYLGNRWREYLLFFGGSLSESMMIFPLKPSFTVDFQLPWLMTPEGNGVFLVYVSEYGAWTKKLGSSLDMIPIIIALYFPCQACQKTIKLITISHCICDITYLKLINISHIPIKNPIVSHAMWINQHHIGPRHPPVRQLFPKVPFGERLRCTALLAQRGVLCLVPGLFFVVKSHQKRLIWPAWWIWTYKIYQVEASGN